MALYGSGLTRQVDVEAVVSVVVAKWRGQTGDPEAMVEDREPREQVQHGALPAEDGDEQGQAEVHQGRLRVHLGRVGRPRAVRHDVGGEAGAQGHAGSEVRRQKVRRADVPDESREESVRSEAGLYRELDGMDEMLR